MLLCMLNLCLVHTVKVIFQSCFALKIAFLCKLYAYTCLNKAEKREKMHVNSTQYLLKIYLAAKQIYNIFIYVHIFFLKVHQPIV